VNFSWEQNFSTTDISHTFCQSAVKSGNIGGVANQNLFPEMHVATCKVVFQQVPHVGDSFSVLPIHYVDRGYVGAILYTRNC